MEIQKKKLDRILYEQAVFISQLPAATKASFDCDKDEYYKTFDRYLKQEKALAGSADVTIGTQNLLSLESRGDKLFQVIMAYFPQNSKQNQIVADKSARRGTVSIRPVKRGTY